MKNLKQEKAIICLLNRPTVIRIIDYLELHPNAGVTAIWVALRVDQSAVSQLLSELLKYGFVTKTKYKKECLYCVDSGRLSAITIIATQMRKCVLPHTAAQK